MDNVTSVFEEKSFLRCSPFAKRDSFSEGCLQLVRKRLFYLFSLGFPHAFLTALSGY